MIRSLFGLSLVILGCAKPYQAPCSISNSHGTKNLPGCSFKTNNKEIKYTEEGTQSTHLTDKNPKILMLGDYFVSGEGLDIPVPAAIQKKLTKSGFIFDVVNAGVRNSTVESLLEVYKTIYKKQKPDLTVLVIGGQSQIFRDYLAFHKNQFCNPLKIYRAFRDDYKHEFFKNTIDSTLMLDKLATSIDSEFMVFVLGTNILKSEFVKTLGSCIGLETLIGNDKLSMEDLISSLRSSGKVPLLIRGNGKPLKAQRIQSWSPTLDKTITGPTDFIFSQIQKKIKN